MRLENVPLGIGQVSFVQEFRGWEDKTLSQVHTKSVLDVSTLQSASGTDSDYLLVTDNVNKDEVIELHSYK